MQGEKDTRRGEIKLMGNLLRILGKEEVGGDVAFESKSWGKRGPAKKKNQKSPLLFCRRDSRKNTQGPNWEVESENVSGDFCFWGASQKRKGPPGKTSS